MPSKRSTQCRRSGVTRTGSCPNRVRAGWTIWLTMHFQGVFVLDRALRSTMQATCLLKTNIFPSVDRTSIPYCDDLLWLQYQLSSRLPRFDVLSRPYNIVQWIDVMDPDIQTILNKLPQLFRSLLQLLPCRNVVEQSRSQQLDILRRKTSTIIVSTSFPTSSNQLQGQLTQAQTP